MVARGYVIKDFRLFKNNFHFSMEVIANCQSNPRLLGEEFPLEVCADYIFYTINEITYIQLAMMPGL